jgi:hypothetical protein
LITTDEMLPGVAKISAIGSGRKTNSVTCATRIIRSQSWNRFSEASNSPDA